MSNHLAIAAATSTFAQLLDKAAGVIDEAKVTIGRPKEGTATGINLYLYQVSPNAASRNADLPMRRADGTLVHRPQAAIDLHYLLTFYGTENKLEPQILMGSAVSLLHAQPMLTQEMIRTEIQRCIADDPNHYLATADLADQVERIAFTPLSLTLEEISKLWSVFFNIPYTLSMAYTASVVLIEAKATPQTALPVRMPNIYATPFNHPVIESAESENGRNAPITSAGTMIIKGRGLKGEITKVRLGEIAVTISTADSANLVTDSMIKLSLGSALFAGEPLRAGVLGLQVVHPRMMGTPAVEHLGIESNVIPLVLHPTVTVQSASATAMTLRFSPRVGKAQRVIAMLNEYGSLSEHPLAYTIQAPSRNGITDESITETDTITFSLTGIKPGEYLLRVQVDGAQSPLETDPDPNNPRYIHPRITIP